MLDLWCLIIHWSLLIIFKSELFLDYFYWQRTQLVFMFYINYKMCFKNKTCFEVLCWQRAQLVLFCTTNKKCMHVACRPIIFFLLLKSMKWNIHVSSNISQTCVYYLKLKKEFPLCFKADISKWHFPHKHFRRLNLA